MITSTRSNASADARRDFDGFDVDEELARLRRALREDQWPIAAELAARTSTNIFREEDRFPWHGSGTIACSALTISNGVTAARKRKP